MPHPADDEPVTITRREYRQLLANRRQLGATGNRERSLRHRVADLEQRMEAIAKAVANVGSKDNVAEVFAEVRRLVQDRQGAGLNE